MTPQRQRRTKDDGAAIVLELEDPRAASSLFGQRNENLTYLEKALGVGIHSRGKRLTLTGAASGDLAFTRDLISQLYDMALAGLQVEPVDIERAVRILSQHPQVKLTDIFLDAVLHTDRGRAISPKGLAQKRYVDAIRRFDIVFGVGPAGTGKTYLAMAMALDELLKKRVKRIILTRPAVEAGERLGFLPGDLAEKVNPYLRPLKDALHDMVELERANRLIERGDIEVAPLAFMRGRTLNDSFVILDEAQNSTKDQMKMFLTRLGFHTKAVVTGDVTQVDLPVGQQSGLSHSVEILKDIQGICVCTFTEVDVVRHPLVMEIIRAYDRAGEAQVR